MLRSLIPLIIFIGAIAPGSQAAVWTEEFFGFQRTELRKLTLPATAIWEEYGFEEGEEAVYTKDGVSFTASAWRFNDSTSALGVYQWQRPSGYRPSELAELAVESESSLYIASGNYVLHFQGYKPTFEELQGLLLILPMTERSALPTLPEYLPTDGLIAGSERFVIGPAGLEQYEPRIPPSVAAFQYSTEVQLGSYQTPAGRLDLAILSYPTPHIARDRLAELRMLPGTVVKREGPMGVVALDPPDPDEAQRILGRVNYRATITWDQILPSRQWSMADILINAGLLVGLLALFSLVGGLGVAGLRILQRRAVAGTSSEDPMILLHLEDKS